MIEDKSLYIKTALTRVGFIKNRVKAQIMDRGDVVTAQREFLDKCKGSISKNVYN